MPKRNYVQAKKEIEALMLEVVDCVAEVGISKWSDVWDSSFETKNILEEGKVIDFTYSEKALSLQSALNEGVEKAMEVARANDTPEFFDYLLGEVKIEGDFKTYNRPHIRTEKKYFNISQGNAKKYYTSKLLLAIVNVAPEGSQAYHIRQSCKELTVLSFGYTHKRVTGVSACIFDFKHISNFVHLEKLELYGLSDWINVDLISNFPDLRELNIEGSKQSNQYQMDERYLKKCTTHLSARLPKNLNIKKISVADVVNVTDPEDLFKI